MKRLYLWMMRLAGSPQAEPALAAVAFAESSFFPIPPDVMLIPMVLAQRAKAWWFATLATVSSVIGGLAGYAIGFFLFQAVGTTILALYGYQGRLDEVFRWFNDWGVWILLVKGMTPFPYKVLTILAGAAQMSLVPFILASILARAMRFFLVAGLLYWYGEPVRAFVETRLTLVTTLFVVALVGGFLAIRYVPLLLG
jgi:membrane protein YqaA with SNARE-associated domain